MKATNNFTEKTYIASYTNGRDECWDLHINAKNYAEARKTARAEQKTYGRLWSLHLKRGY